MERVRKNVRVRWKNEGGIKGHFGEPDVGEDRMVRGWESATNSSAQDKNKGEKCASCGRG